MPSPWCGAVRGTGTTLLPDVLLFTANSANVVLAVLVFMQDASCAHFPLVCVHTFRCCPIICAGHS